MNQKIIETLEFKKVTALIEPFVVTEQGLQELRELVPMTDSSRLQQSFDELRDMTAIFEYYPHFSIGKTLDISPAITRLRMDAELNIPELLSLKKVLQVSKQLSDFYADLDNVHLSQLQYLFAKIETFPSLQGSLQAINDSGSVEDFASEKLLNIRRKIQELDQQVCQVMQEFLKTKVEMLSDTVIASRNGRNVLPVKNSFRNKIAGVVHDISASGSTVYVEPRSVIALNEKITNAQAEERHEISRILADLSDMVRPHATAIKNNAWVIGHLDLVLSKHLFAQHYEAVIPSLSLENDIVLLNVRHPLLAHPVANHLHFDKKLIIIVVTGPNTGGKTIMLKTLGLTQLMAQSGLPIFADKGSRVGIFEQIFADIGDEQSIEQSLSTFSSHMTHIVDILDKADEHSLVLFDELGAGTDPQEGSSIAMAVLDDLRMRGIKTMATTHYPELKAYGVETPSVENASMEFDTDSLQPTYRFLQGVPGRSNAFEIARRLGLPDLVIGRAKNWSDTDNDVNRMIEKLESQTLESRKRLERIRDVEQENFKMNRALHKLYNELSRERESELNKARIEAQNIVNVALSESEEILKNLHEQAHLKPHQIIEAKSQLKKLAPETVDLSKNKVLKKAKEEKRAKIGDDIVVTAYGQRGTLTSQLKDGRFEAQVGLMKMTLRRDEFTLVKAEKNDKPQQKQLKIIKRLSAKGTHARLDLRGKRYEEAMQELDEFIDQALLNNMAQVDIIHGIGTGVIREGVTKYLRNNRNVKEFAYAPQNAGGSGATIVTLK